MDSRKKRRNIENNKDKNNKWKVISFVLFVFMIFVYYQVYILINYTMGKDVTEKQISLYKWMVSIVNKEEIVEKETSVNIAVLGNIKAKGELIDSYMQDGIVNYDSIFKNIQFEEYDYTIANLNTAIVADTKPNGEFYANNKLIKALKNSHIDMLVTANKELGQESDKTVKETLSAITQQEIEPVGASTSDTNYPYFMLEQNNIKIAILAYVDSEYAQNDSVNVYSKKKFKNAIMEIKKKKADSIIVFFDTLRSETDKYSQEKQEILQEIVEMGANIVISSDTYDQKLYVGNNKSKYIKFSLGDVIGLQEGEDSDTSKVLEIKVIKESKNGKVNKKIEVNDKITLVALSNSNMTRYKVVDLDKEINNFDERTDRITLTEYNYLKKIRQKIY